MSKDIVLQRLREISIERKDILENNLATIINKDAFLVSYKDKTKMPFDSPKAAYLGYTDIDSYVDYYCPMEDFSDEELDEIDAFRNMPNG
jgi:hypothetical protein